jgi:hypothetical protein
MYLKKVPNTPKNSEFFCFVFFVLKVTEEKSRIRNKCADPGIRIRTKMSRIRNTAPEK